MREHSPERKRDMDVAHVTLTDEPEGSYRGRRAEVPQGVLGAPEQALVTGTQQLTILPPPPSQPTHVRPAPVQRRQLSNTWRRSESTSPPHTSSLHRMTTSDNLAEYTDYVYSDEDEFENARPKMQLYPDDGEEEEGQSLVTTSFPTSLTCSPVLLWDTASTAHIVGNADLLDD